MTENKDSFKLYHVGGDLYETYEQHQARLAAKEAERLEGMTGIRDLLSLVAAWVISYPFSLLAAITYLSQNKYATFGIRDLTLPDVFFSTAELGYYLLLPLALFMIYAFFKKKKYFIYLEIINLISRFILLGFVLTSLGSIDFIFSELCMMLNVTIIGSVITIIYFKYSKRVKLTFTK